MPLISWDLTVTCRSGYSDSRLGGGEGAPEWLGLRLRLGLQALNLPSPLLSANAFTPLFRVSRVSYARRNTRPERPAC